MSIAIIQWALQQDVKNAEFKVLVTIASACDFRGRFDGGQRLLEKATGYSDRTVREAIKKLRSLELLHTERQYGDFVTGRQVDVIYLHPDNTRFLLPSLMQSPEEIERARLLRRKYETFDSIDVSPSQSVPEEISGTRSKPVDNFSKNDITPSQMVPVKTSGTADATGRIAYPTGGTLPVENVKLPVAQKNALKGNARATRALKGNLLTDLNQSISQSVNPSTSAREKSTTDGLTSKPSFEKENPPIADFIGDMPAHQAVSQLRSALHHRKISTELIDNATLRAVIEHVVARRKDGKIQNVVGLLLTAIQREDGGLPALVEQVHARSTYHKQQTQRQEQETLARTLIECPIHTDVQHPSHVECPCCLADAKASPSSVEPPLSAADVAAFRARIRANQAEKLPR